MQIVTIPCGFDNYAYLLVCKSTGSAAVIDPGEAYPVSQQVHSLGVTLQMILCTHHHHDHIGGVADLLGEWPDLEVYGYREDGHRLPGLTQPLVDGDQINLSNNIGRVIHTPGHTTGGLCYLFQQDCFTGDTLFGGGCGRLFEGTAEMLFTSLQKIVSLPAETRLYFGHEYTEKNLKFALQFEPDSQDLHDRLEKVRRLRASDQPTTPSVLAEEMATNPFLRCHQTTVQDNCRLPEGEHGELEVFTSIRRLRDDF